MPDGQPLIVSYPMEASSGHDIGGGGYYGGTVGTVRGRRSTKASTSDAGKTEYVGGYTRKDGTYVRSYYRRPSH
jgi:hypothetical protein